MKKQYILDSHSYYTTIEADYNAFNTHVLENITVTFSDGVIEKCQLVLCNNRLSFDQTSGMGKIEDWIEDDEDWEGICSKCRVKYEKELENERS